MTGGMIGMFIALTAMYIWWYVSLAKHNKAIAKWHDDRLAAQERAVDSLEAAANELENAGLALCAAMHSHYHLDDEALPGLITVKCMDCRETIGTVADQADTLNLANTHVREKYDAMRAQIFGDKEEVKQDQG